MTNTRPASDGHGPTAPKGKLEDRLGAFICVIEEEYASELVKIKERQEWQRHYQEQQRQREEAERRRQEEEKKIANLAEMTERWAKAERIRRFLAAVEERASHGDALDPASNLAHWIAWARRYAQEHDRGRQRRHRSSDQGKSRGIGRQSTGKDRQKDEVAD